MTFYIASSWRNGHHYKWKETIRAYGQRKNELYT